MFARHLLLGVARLALAAVVSLHAAGPNPLLGGEPKEPVRLSLSSASAKSWGKDVLFHCEAVLVNETGAAINVKSNFYSAFDGLHLVLLDENGTRLLQQSSVRHQAPYDVKPRLFPLAKGENRKAIGFPVSGLPKGIKSVRVLLVGTLPGNDYPYVLCSNLATVTITAAKE
jgi:hypothetical protein